MRRFFYTTSDDTEYEDLPRLHTIAIGGDVSLTDSIAHHWCRVLRANIGDTGVLFDGFGGEYHVQLKTITKKTATATLLARVESDNTAPIISKIGLVMSRGERMDYAIQKATELGVTAIQLLSSQHGEVILKPAQVAKKLAHWQHIAIAACEQCGLNRPPLILAPLPIHTWLQDLTLEGAESEPLDLMTAVSPAMVALSQDAYYHVLTTSADLRIQMSVPAAGQPTRPVALTAIMAQELPFIELLIGPEGGLSHDECVRAQSVGFEPWQIGSRVLRTETAPVVALATLHALCH